MILIIHLINFYVKQRIRMVSGRIYVNKKGQNIWLDHYLHYMLSSVPKLVPQVNFCSDDFYAFLLSFCFEHIPKLEIIYTVSRMNLLSDNYNE